MGTEELRDFRRWKSTLSFGLGDLSINLQLLVLPGTHRARGISHPGPGCSVQMGRLERGGEGTDPRSPRKQRRREGPRIPPVVPLCCSAKSQGKETWMHIPL